MNTLLALWHLMLNQTGTLIFF